MLRFNNFNGDTLDNVAAVSRGIVATLGHLLGLNFETSVAIRTLGHLLKLEECRRDD